MFERIEQLRLGQTGMPCQVEERARTQVTRPRRHYKALERREPHRRGDRPAVAHGSQRGSGAQMTGHNPEASASTLQQLGGTPRGVGVRETVEAVPPDAPALAPLR